MKPRIEISAREPAQVRGDAVIVFQFAGDAKPAGLPVAMLPAAQAELTRGEFRGERGKVFTLVHGAGRERTLVIVAGLGARAELTAETLRLAAAAAIRRAQSDKAKTVAAGLPAGPGRLSPAERATGVLEGFLLGLYRFERFITEDARRAHTPETIVVAAGRLRAAAQKAAGHAQAVAAASALARDLVNLPATDLTPEAMVEEIRRAVKGTKIRLKVLEAKDLERERMGALLAVARGSDHPPRLVHLIHRAPRRAKGRLAFVGKGVTFDSGGYNIKTGDGMHGMKGDMAGAAAVLGAILALDRLGAPVEVHAILGLAENLVSAQAYKPGDVLTTRSGVTVEVNNTDAEGRLVLADALDYVRTEVKPQAVVDLATLTGACVVALGPQCSGLFASHDALARQLLDAADRAGEKMWRLPLIAEYRDQLKSDIADLRNSGKRYGGAIAAALFLQKFVDAKIPWAHLDIAGPAFLDDAHPFWGKGGSGAGVATLVQYALAI